jgi:hypothetical protein
MERQFVVGTGEITMKKSVAAILTVSVFGMTTMTGCETMGGTAGTGAALGGLAGGVIGHQSGRAIEGAVIGALVGAAAGAIVHDVRERRMRTAQETYQTYDYQPGPGQSLQLNIEDGHIEPTGVRPGRSFESRMDYAVMGAGDGVPVREQFVLLRNDQVLGTVYEGSPVRTDGTYRRTVAVELPADAPTGTYRLANTVSSQGVTRTQNTDFQVASVDGDAKPVSIPVRVAVVHD